MTDRRKLVVSTIMSLDGFVAGPGGNPMALPMDTFFDEQNLERQRTADTLLLGATTYRGFRSYWPLVAVDPTVSPAVQADPGLADLHRETGRRNDAMPKLVVSDTLETPTDGAWADSTTVVGRRGAHGAVTELKARDGADILVFGSAVLWNVLLELGLVDELFVMVAPVVLGGGAPAFTASRSHDLRLVDTLRRDGSANVLLRYAVAPRPAS